MSVQILSFVYMLSLLSSCSGGWSSDQETRPSASPTPAAASVPSGSPLLDDDTCYVEQGKAYSLSLSTDTREKAIEKYSYLIEMRCYSDTLYLHYGSLLARTGDYEGAAQQYRVAIAHDPENWYAHWSLAQILVMHLAQYEEGLNEIQISRRLDDGGNIGYVYEYYLGRAYEGLEMNRKAIEHYEAFIAGKSRVVDSDPQLTETKERLARLKEKPGIQ